MRRRSIAILQSTGRSRRRRHLPRIESLEPRSLLSVYMVTTADDNAGINPSPGAGTGTLRQAIIDSNAAPAPAGMVNLIDFNIPGSGAETIAPLSPLPEITAPVNIDGYTQ